MDDRVDKTHIKMVEIIATKIGFVKSKYVTFPFGIHATVSRIEAIPTDKNTPTIIPNKLVNAFSLNTLKIKNHLL